MHYLRKRILCGTLLSAVGLIVLLPSLAQASVSSGSARALLSASQSAVTREHSVHVVSISSSNPLGATPNVAATVAITTDAARAEGIQHVAYQQGTTSGQEIIEEVDGVGYFRGDAFTLQNFNGFSATAAASYAEVWLKVTKSDKAFAKLTSGLTISTIPAQMVLPQPQLLPASSPVGGTRVKQLRAVFSEPSGTVTGFLYVRSRGAPLPVEQMYMQNGGGHGTDVFSNWNRPVSLIPPTSSVPFSATGQ